MYLNHVPIHPRYSLSICPNYQDITLKTYIKTYLSTSENLVHEITDHQTFLNFSIKRISPSSNFFSAFQD